jgi:hypothetical protein
MRFLPLCLLATFVTGCANVQVQIKPIKITSFEQGLIRFDKSGTPQIYAQGAEFAYKENGVCIANGREIPCMWHGFTINFEKLDEAVVLQCTTESKTPISWVNPTKTFGRLTKQNWELPLTRGSSQFTNPNYTSIKQVATVQVIDTNASCTHLGTEVIKWRFDVIVNPTKG